MLLKIEQARAAVQLLKIVQASVEVQLLKMRAEYVMARKQIQITVLKQTHYGLIGMQMEI